jgi:membrane protease YdiL (CAAX protease family)
MLSLTFFMVSYLVIIFVVYHLTQTNKVWQWPFRHASSLFEAYMRILYYLPMMVVPIYSLYWLEYANIPTRQYFRWNRFSWTFLLGLAVSIYYTLELLVFHRPPSIRGIGFWPPIVALSLLNAICEEIMYRIALYRLIRQAQYPKWVAGVVQSLVYSLIHYMISGALMGTFSLIYGLVMQLVVNRNRSIIPAIICHFIIDIGCIGLPVLRMR